MSSINDALRRTRRQADASGDLHPIPAPRSFRSRWRSPAFWAGLGVAAGLIAAVVWYLHPIGSVDPVQITEVPAQVAVAEPIRPAAPVKTEPAAPPTPAPAQMIASSEDAVQPATPRPASPTPPVETPPATALQAPDTAALAEALREQDPNRLPAQAEPEPTQQPSPEPATAKEHFLAARAAQNRGRDSEAIFHYRQALLLDPRQAEAYLNLGNIFLFRQRAGEKALEMYKQVLKLDPDNKMAHNNLGVLLMQRGLLSQADTEFTAAVQQDPDYVDALYNKACLAARQNRPEEAFGFLERAAAIQPEAAVWAAEDEDLKNLHGKPEFKALVQGASANTPRGK